MRDLDASPIDGQRRPDAPSFDSSLSFDANVEACGNGVLDGDEDCDPPDGVACGSDCQSLVEHDCANYLDDDGNGFLDCDDPACQATASCAPGSVPLGNPCSSHSDCAALAAAPLCLSEAAGGFPGGYCTEFCDLDAPVCPRDALCMPAEFSVHGICATMCADALDCRPGYSCIRGGYRERLCWPDCRVDSACDDGSCNTDTGRCGTKEGSCGDGVDDDGDGVVDCSDHDCIGASPCTAACLDASDLPGGVETSTEGASSLFSGACLPFGLGAATPERIFRYTTPADGAGHVTLTLSSEHDLGLYVRADCGLPASEVACMDSVGAWGDEVLELAALEPSTSFYVFVDGFSVADVGEFSLRIDFKLDLCGDNVVSGKEQCDPPTFAPFTPAVCSLSCTLDPESSCGNLVDDDNDRLLDCADPDCTCTSGAAPAGAACSNASDCAANADDPICFAEAVAGSPGGSCSEFCRIAEGSDDCPWGASCLALPGTDLGTCHKTCGSNPDCRDGYVCALVPSERYAQPVCVARCSSDAQCATTMHCNLDSASCSPTLEDCSANGMDEDGDGRVDCEDLECSGSSYCLELVASVCEGAAVATETMDGDTTLGTTLFAGSCVGGGHIPERLLVYTPGVPGEMGILTISMDSEEDLGLYVREDCANSASEFACRDSELGGYPEVLELEVIGGEPVYVFVDGFTGADVGAFQVSFVYRADGS